MNYGHTRWVDPDRKLRIAPPKGPLRSIWDAQISEGRAREVAERRAAKQQRSAAAAA